MTGPFNQAGGNAWVGWQSQYTNINLTTSPEQSPEDIYAEGVANLNGRNAERARELIWLAMTRWQAKGQPLDGEVLFHWLVAMLSGRTARQFSVAEVSQLREYQSWCTGAGGDQWADGVRLIYRLLDSALRPPGAPPGPDLDASLLQKQFDALGEKQRRRLLGLDLFLSGPRRDKMWQDKLEDAKFRQRRWHDRVERAWVFFWPAPAEVRLPGPRPPVDGDRLRARLCVLLVAGLACSFAVVLLWHEAFLGALGYVIALAGGTAVAAAGLERRFRAERGRRRPERPGWMSGAASASAGDVDRRLQKYFDRYGRDRGEIVRGLWRNAPDDVRRFYRDDIMTILQRTRAHLDEIDWYLRYEVHQMIRRGEGGILRIPPDQPSVTGPAPVVRRAGWAVAVLGCALAIFALWEDAPRSDELWLVVALAAACLVRAWWLPAALKCRHYDADQRIRDRRQVGIDEEFARWRDVWEHRPSDAEMADWLDLDRTVLLGRALDYFRLPRSRVLAHGFIEKGKPGARKGQRDGGLVRYQRYLIWMFLLANDGVRQVRASLDFLNGILVEREEIVYGYGSIAAVRVTRKRGGPTFVLNLTGGDPIKIQVKEDTDPAARPPGGQPDQDKKAESEENAETDEDIGDMTTADGLDVASIANTLHLLEGVAADGRQWLHEHSWANAWTGESG